MDARRRNNVTVLGQGSPSIILGHGLGWDQTTWRHLAPRLARDHRVVLFDYIGCGKSDRSAFAADRYKTLTGYARDVVEIGEALALDRAVFVAHSVSAMIALEACALAPRLFERLVLITPTARYLDDPETGYIGGFRPEDVDESLALMDANWAECASMLSHRTFDDPALAAEMERVFMGNDPSIARAFALATLTADERPLLSKIEIPCLLVPCTGDNMVPVSGAEYMRDRLPRAEYRPLHAAGHCPQMSHAPQLEALIREFLPS